MCDNDSYLCYNVITEICKNGKEICNGTGYDKGSPFRVLIMFTRLLQLEIFSSSFTTWQIPSLWGAMWVRMRLQQ